MVQAKFIGGPYDGHAIDPDTINRCCTLCPVLGASPPRLFVLMPPVKDWDRVVRGEITKDEVSEGVSHPYGRIHSGETVEFHDADANGAFAAALRGEHPAPEDVFDSHEDELAYELECRLAQFLAGYADVAIPPGTLGAGMSFSQTTDTNRDYDKENGEITITGIVKLTVRRTKEPTPQIRP